MPRQVVHRAFATAGTCSHMKCHRKATNSGISLQIPLGGSCATVDAKTPCWASSSSSSLKNSLKQFEWKLKPFNNNVTISMDIVTIYKQFECNLLCTTSGNHVGTG